MRVLLVEDEPALRMTMAANLELEGLEIVEAEDGEQAIELVSTQPFDLVLSDVRMPRLSGIAMYQRLKTLAPELPVILMTAFALEDQLRQAVRQGVYTVLSKPFDVERVMPVLTRASRRPVVLVLDRSVNDAELTARALEEAGLRARAITGAEDAIDAIGDGAVDVCITDLGRDDAQALVNRILDVAPDVSVIAIAASLDAGTMARIAASVRSFVQRPFSVPELIDIVARARREPGASR